MALSPAQKQRAYRDRQRLKQSESSNVTAVQFQAAEIVASMGLSQMDVDTRSYFVGLLIGRLCPELKQQYIIAGLFDSIGNVTGGGE